MELFVDDQQVDDGFVGDQTLEEALKHVQSSICPAGHVVVGMRCDGQDVAPNAMAPALAKAASTFKTLEVFTGTRRTLVIDAMTQASEALKQTEDSCLHVADLLTEGQTAEGIQELGKCLGVWQQIHEAVSHSILMLEIDPAQKMVDDEPLSSLISRPKAILVQVKDALKSQDHVLLADIMQYEFEVVTKQWHEVIAVLREEAEQIPDEPAKAN